jgi:hypothetical protein
VLVPQLYVVARVGDLASSGSLLAGSDVNLHLNGAVQLSAANDLIARAETGVTIGGIWWLLVVCHSSKSLNILDNLNSPAR